jgi:hypothetical protein
MFNSSFPLSLLLSLTDSLTRSLSTFDVYCINLKHLYHGKFWMNIFCAPMMIPMRCTDKIFNFQNIEFHPVSVFPLSLSLTHTLTLSSTQIYLFEQVKSQNCWGKINFCENNRSLGRFCSLLSHTISIHKICVHIWTMFAFCELIEGRGRMSVKSINILHVTMQNMSTALQ